MRLANNVAIITGGASGIGQAIALRFAREGAKVVIVDIDHGRGEETAAAIHASQGEAIAVRADVSQESDVKAVVDAALASYGALHILVNNAATFTMGMLNDLDFADWDRSMDVNVKSMAIMGRYAAPRIGEAGGGAIINMASISAFRATQGMTAYGASKAAVIGLTKCMAFDCWQYHIRVNAICPGVIRTPALERIASTRNVSIDGLEQHCRQSAIMQRLGTPEDIAGVAVFLASDDAAFMTGTHVVVDGGQTAL